jgi:hypothetical protein
MIQHRLHLKVCRKEFRIHKPLRNSAANTIPFVLFLRFFYTLIFIGRYTEFRIHEPIRNSAEFRGIVQ